MPPRSFYLSPRQSDYDAFLNAFVPDAAEEARGFIQEHGVPYIRDAQHLAAYIGVSASLIRQIQHNPAYHYREFSIEKADGTRRQICTPKTYLKVIQWWILDNILEKHSCSDVVHGFVRGRSYITNGVAHAGKNHILNVDIQQFFPSITKAMVSDVFSNLGYSGEAVELLASLVTYENEAPTGAPTSPMIGNIVLASFDEEIQGLSKTAGVTYTRYADDLTFSSTDRIENEFFAAVKAKVEKFGFALNDRKTRFMGQGDRMEVTGTVVNQGVNTSRPWRNKVRGVLHRAQMNLDEYADQYHLVSGIYGTLASVDPGHKKPLTVKARQVLNELAQRRRQRQKKA